MHELSLCGAIADVVARHADGRRVATVHVRVGQLRQVVPETLVHCWDLVSAGSELSGSHLAVETVPAVLRCLDCGCEAPLGDRPSFACSSCRSTRVEVRAGEELLITSLDLAEA